MRCKCVCGMRFFCFIFFFFFILIFQIVHSVNYLCNTWFVASINDMKMVLVFFCTQSTVLYLCVIYISLEIHTRTLPLIYIAKHSHTYSYSKRAESYHGNALSNVCCCDWEKQEFAIFCSTGNWPFRLCITLLCTWATCFIHCWIFNTMIDVFMWNRNFSTENFIYMKTNIQSDVSACMTTNKASRWNYDYRQLTEHFNINVKNKKRMIKTSPPKWLNYQSCHY